MTTPDFLGTHHCVGVGRRVFQQLRQSLERDAGLQAAGYLQEAGFAAGEEVYGAYTAWLAREYGVEQPHELDMQFLGDTLSRFFAEMGWGPLTTRALGPAVLALDSAEWAEAAEQSGDYPSCHLSCGLLADFFGRLSDGLVAVMEVECRSRGDARCRFIAGAPETLAAVYERMAQGLAYGEALGLDGA
jgi:predicted hydrocarbon binding protein